MPGSAKPKSTSSPTISRARSSRSSHWGMVRIIPKESATADVVVKGKIIECNGESLVLQVEVRDATGRLWFDRKFGADATEASYADLQPGQKDPFQDVYHAVANAIAEQREKLTPEEIRNIRTVSKLKFAKDFAPDAFGRYLTADKKGISQVNRLPAEDDPMMKRLMSIRERESMFVDALNGYYENFYNGMWPSYENWRKMNLTERVAMAKVKQDAYTRIAAGVALIALGALVGIRNDFSNADPGRDHRPHRRSGLRQRHQHLQPSRNAQGSHSGAERIFRQ